MDNQQNSQTGFQQQYQPYGNSQQPQQIIIDNSNNNANTNNIHAGGGLCRAHGTAEGQMNCASAPDLPGCIWRT